MPPHPRSRPPTKPRRRYAPRMAPSERREQLLDAALRVIVEQGYEGVSIEAIARGAGVTRPVIYDHFPNLGTLLKALILREERFALDELDQVIPDPAPEDPAQLLAAGVRRFLDSVAARPATWRIILAPLDGTPAIVREHVETNRRRILARLEELVRWGVAGDPESEAVDVELAARSILAVAEEAGRQVLADSAQFPPERYEAFALMLVSRLRGS
jgi:AcrR family transcriptional regulator